MAVEVKDQRYWFTPLVRDRLDGNLRVISAEAAFRKVVVSEPVVRNTSWELAEPVVNEGWCYNPLHDMESIGWLFARSILYQDHYFERMGHIPMVQFGFKSGGKIIDPLAAETVEKRIERIKAYYVFGRALFVTRTERYTAMYRDLLNSQLQANPLFPGIAPLGGVLKIMRNKLVEQYQRAEMDITTIDHTCAKEVTLEFIRQLHNAYEYLQDVASSGYEIKTRSLQSEFELFCQQDGSAFSARTKRPRDGDNDDYSVSHPSKFLRTETSSYPYLSPNAGPPLLPATSSTAVLVATATSVALKPAEQVRRRTAGVLPATRTLRSHTRKTTTLKAVETPPAYSSPARTSKPVSRQVKVTKDDGAVRGAAGVAADVKSKTRKCH